MKCRTTTKELPLPPLRDTSFSFFLLNRADISTPSFLPSLKVLLRHRN